jgi:hypothetical protein
VFDEAQRSVSACAGQTISALAEAQRQAKRRVSRPTSGFGPRTISIFKSLTFRRLTPCRLGWIAGAGITTLDKSGLDDLGRLVEAGASA